MPTFRYRAYDSAGKTIAGDMEAAGVKDAQERLKKTGLYPAEIAESELIERSPLAYLGIKGGVTAETLSIATRQLATLIATGTNISEALAVLVENTSNVKLKSTIIKVKEAITGGATLSRALEAHPRIFSPFYRGIVASGEASGSLDKVLPRLADYLETRARITRDIKAALTYPLLMTVVGAGVLSFLFVFVIPKITRIFEDTQSTLPVITIILIKLTGVFRLGWPFITAGIIAGVWFMRRYRGAPRVKARMDSLLIRLPLFGGLATCFYVSTLTRTLGSLLKGGVHMLKALEITKEAVNHTVFNRILDTAITDCTGGASLSSSLKRHGEVPPIVAHMVSVGERGGNLDEMLLKTADTYEDEFQAGVKKALNLIEPVMILVMGVIVGFIVLAILLPIFQLNQIVH